MGATASTGRQRTAIFVVALALLAATCVVAAPVGAADPARVTLHAPTVIAGAPGQPSRGTTSAVTVTYGQPGGSELRVGFRPDAVAGTSDQWRAAGWNAVAVAMLLDRAEGTGGQVDYDVHGRIDGSSAGALLTVGVLALMRGDRIKPHITMTGAISPDGTIEPVGGIPEKVDGAKQAHARTLLIPLGERKHSDATGKVVDAVVLGAQKRVHVEEVGDIYAAYKTFTGKTLPRPKAATDVTLSGSVVPRVQAKVTAQLAAFDASVADFDRLAPAIQNDLESFRSSAAGSRARAATLASGAMPAGAYQQSLEAAATMSATVKTGQLLGVYLTQGAAAFADQVKSSSDLTAKLAALAGELKAFRPETVSDASALIDASSNAVNAIGTSHDARELLAAAGGQSDPTQALDTAILGGVLYELSGAQVQGAQDIFEIGKRAGGAKLSKVATEPDAAFFRAAAAANLRAFDALIVNPHALQTGVSAPAVKGTLANDDFDYALVQSTQAVLDGGLARYFGTSKAAGFATLGAAVRLYTRTAELLSKYSSLGEVNSDLEVTGISNDQAMQSALDLGRSQVQRGVGVLRSKKVSPVLVVGAYEIAGVDAQGGASDKLDALGEYLSAFVGSRVLAYVGGFPTTGTK